jgi:hypothetical protein
MYTSVDFTSQNRWAEEVSYTNLVSALAVTLKIDYYYYYYYYRSIPFLSLGIFLIWIFIFFNLQHFYH